MQDLIAINSRNAKVRIVLVGAVIFALLFAWLAIRWQLGSMIASFTTPDNPGGLQAADLAIGLAPRDPVARWLRASIEMDSDKDSAVKMFEETVRLSPYDYRL